MLLSIVPEMPDLTLTAATIESDATLHALTFNGTASVLGLTAELLVTADWNDAATDIAPTLTIGVKFAGFSIDTINDAWTTIGGELPSFTIGWATIASTPHTLTLADLPPSATTFYGANADGHELGTDLAFRGELDVSVWKALANALQSLSIDASAIVIEGEAGSPGLLFGNGNADESSLSLSATVSGTNLPQWMTASSTTVGLVLDGGAPKISFDHQVSTDFGGATNTFVAAIQFDPAAYAGATVTATFALDGTLNAPFGADFLTISNLQLEVTADLGASSGAFDETLTADVIEFEAKANLVDVTEEDNSVDIGGNLTFQMRMSDFGEPNDSDTIGWTLYDKNGTLLFSSNWTGMDTAERVAKGNLVVHV